MRTARSKKLEALVDRILEFKPDTTIFLASLAPVQWTDGSDWPEYQAVNAMAEQIASADPNDRIEFVDLKRTLEPLLDKQADFTDGVHLSESGAQKAARVWFEALIASGVLLYTKGGKP
jgi:hypothetical protein